MNEKSLAFFVIILLCVGFMALSSFEVVQDYIKPSNNSSVVLNHLIKLMFAIVFFIVFLYTDYRLLFSKHIIAGGYILSIALLIAVFFFPETETGAHRWIDLGVFSFQPSEVVKIYVILFLSWYVEKNQLFMKRFFRGFLKPILLISPFLILILLEPDFSTFVLIFLLVILTLYVAETRGVYVLSLFMIILIFFTYAYESGSLDKILKGYQIERLVSYLKGNVSEQVMKAVDAVRSGGIAGKGLMLGEEKLFVPVVTSDFVLAIVGEELGFIGLGVVLFSFYGLVHSLVKVVSKMQPIPAVKTFIAGFAIFIMLQVMVNVGVISGILPVTGVTLPLVSYGGSSLLSTMIGFGIVGNMILESGRE
ncbi:FtsW/RodA/SpoVE family cell cycle protein [Thermotoga sp. KOL6]|uniref:FtsW/RodA/SpoVE family cell cycle protein n=1 Tax=Thermotoga sp. KOL6 TaxID=126741 RepID=UPI000C788AC4|nr:FtsW/RodA/SpoVE family cell cycle protein [Thermotoga sp. KOL6]PLV58988.1 cell division protein FtsW [Thermotoga sp. KOL6]